MVVLGETTGPDPGRGPAGPEDLLRRLEDPSFPFIFRGYDPGAVDALLGEALDALRSAPDEPVDDPISDVAELVRRVASEAQWYRQEAEQTRQLMLDEAEQVLDQARREATALRDEAAREVADARREAAMLRQTTSQELQDLDALRQETTQELQDLVCEIVQVVRRYDEKAAGAILALAEDRGDGIVSPTLRDLLRGAARVATRPTSS